MDLDKIGKISFSIETKSFDKINFKTQISNLEKLFRSYQIGDQGFSYKDCFDEILADIVVDENISLEKIQQLTDSEINQSCNEIFKQTKGYLIEVQELLNKNFDKEKSNISVKELFELFKDIEAVNKQQNENIRQLYSAETAKISDQLQVLMEDSYSLYNQLDDANQKIPEILSQPHQPFQETNDKLEGILQFQQTQTKFLKQSSIDSAENHEKGLIWNKTFFGLSIFSIFVSIFFSYHSSQSSKETDQILLSQQTLISKQNELLSEILEDQVTTSNQIRLLASSNNPDDNKEIVSVLKSIENLLITNNSLLKETKIEIKTAETERK